MTRWTSAAALIPLTAVDATDSPTDVDAVLAGRLIDVELHIQDEHRVSIDAIKMLDQSGPVGGLALAAARGEPIEPDLADPPCDCC